MKNKKGGISILIPFFTVGVLAMLIYVVIAYNVGFSETDHLPVIGEKQQAILDSYAQADAIRIYADHAATQALTKAGNVASTETINHVIQESYSQQLAANKQHPLYRSVELTRSGRQITLALPEPVTVPLSYGPAHERHLQASAVFNRWPVERQPVITSLYGKRDTEVGSPNHPAIDIRAPEGTPVRSVGAGDVISATQYSLYVRMDNGYTCGYLHVHPQISAGSRVAEGEIIAQVANQPGYAPHLDLRCYNHEQPLTRPAANNLFGAEHVGASFETPSDTTYAAIRSDAQNSYLDPYCLFSTTLKEAVKDSIRTDSTLQESLSGLQTRQPITPIENRLDETCNAYTEQGLLASTASLSEAYLQEALYTILEHEGDECTDHAADRGGVTRFGVTADTLSTYRSIPLEQAQQEVCQLTQEQAADIFLEEYLYRPGFDALPAELLPHVWDMSVNHGQAGASRLLQETLVQLGVLTEVQQPLTPINERAVNAAQQAIQQGSPINDALVDRRVEFYQAIVANDESQRIFLTGWLNRAEKFREGLQPTALRTSQGSNRFTLTLHQELTQQQWQAILSRTQIRDFLARCEYGDTQCINSFKQDFVTCTDYAEQLRGAIDSCRLHRRNDCSCAIVAPPVNATLNPYTVYANGTTRAVNWISDDTLEVRFAVVGEREVAVDTQPIWLNNSQPTFRQTDGLKSIDPFDGVLYAQIHEGSQGAIVAFSATNQTPICESTIPATYCKGPQRIHVAHPVATPSEDSVLNLLDLLRPTPLDLFNLAFN